MATNVDTRKYITFYKNKRKYVKCAETRTDDDENILECIYEARDDKHKARKRPHECIFEKDAPCRTEKISLLIF